MMLSPSVLKATLMLEHVTQCPSVISGAVSNNILNNETNQKDKSKANRNVFKSIFMYVINSHLLALLSVVTVQLHTTSKPLNIKCRFLFYFFAFEESSPTMEKESSLVIM